MKKTILILLILSLIFTTGCWDMIELEDRLLPYSVGIDLSRGDTEQAKEKDLFICFSFRNESVKIQTETIIYPDCV